MKPKLIVGFLLTSLICWAYPIQTAAQIYVESNSPSVSEVHDQSGATNAQADSSERSTENEAKKEVSTPKNVSSRPTSNNGIYNGRHYSKEEVQALIKDYSAQYGISADLPLRVANCESGFNQLARNKNSSASGVFQYLKSTWAGTDEGRLGISVFDADANVLMAIKSIASGGISNWNASRSCWSQ